jgi:hypothetical protein
MDLFNNREIAAIIWFILLFIYILYNIKARKSFYSFINALFGFKILVSIGLMILYTIGMVYILKRLSCWNISLFKDTLIWFVFSGIILCFGTVSSKYSKNVFRNIFVDNLNLIIVVEYVINLYVFPLLIELVLIPLIVFIVLIESIAQLESKYESVIKLMKYFQSTIGLIIIGFVLVNLFNNYDHFVNIDNLLSFILPILLTLLFIPFVYFFLLFVSYESLFLKLRFGFNKSSELIKYAKCRIVTHCNISINKVISVSKFSDPSICHIKDVNDVDKILESVVRNK